MVVRMALIFALDPFSLIENAERISSLYDCNLKTLSKAHFSANYVHPFMRRLSSSRQPSKVAH
jgi:hypothetical protein